MNTNISAHKFELSGSLKVFTGQKIKTLTKFYNKITHAKVFLEVDDGHHRHGKVNRCNVVLHVAGSKKEIHAESWSENMHTSINDAIEQAVKEIKKIKEKVTHRNYKTLRQVKEMGLQ